MSISADLSVLSLCALALATPRLPLTLVLLQMGCGGLCLPAAKETIATWISGFGFGPMPFEREAKCRRELHILVFPGTRLLVRDFHPVRHSSC